MADEPDPPDEDIPDGGSEQSGTLPGGNPPGQELNLQVDLPDAQGITGFGLTIAVAWDSGLGSAAVAGGARSRTEFWRIRAERSWKVVTFAVTRTDDKPVLPHIDTGDPNDVLISKQVAAIQPDVMPGDGRSYGIVGQYTYAMQVAADAAQTPITIPNTVLGFSQIQQLYPQEFRRDLHGVPAPPSEYDGRRVDF